MGRAHLDLGFQRLEPLHEGGIHCLEVLVVVRDLLEERGNLVGAQAPHELHGETLGPNFVRCHYGVSLCSYLWRLVDLPPNPRFRGPRGRLVRARDTRPPDADPLWAVWAVRTGR